MLTSRTLAVATATAALAFVPATALAKGGDVVKRGSCTKGSTYKLKLRADDGRIQTELEVDQNVAGVKWSVVLRRNGSVAASTSATTTAPSGSFSVRRLLTNGPGADTISARAT